jgi:taurine dioxygenase
MDRKFDPLTPHTGTEIVGVDLATAGPAEIDSIKRLLKERLVLVFRDQRIAREQHKALGRHFGLGVLHRHRSDDRMGCDPEVLQVRATGMPRHAAIPGWHADLSSEASPISTSLFYLLTAPEGGGGDTVFANMYLAYEALSEPIKELVGRLTAIHDGALPWKETCGCDPDSGEAFTRAEHPVVVRHPGTGRKVLWVNRAFTTRLLGVTALESRYLLETLFHHIESNPAMYCRVRWRANTLVMWDNIALQYHTCRDYPSNTRYGEWVSSVGQSLEAAR